ncbi:glycosyltransferase family 39 protein [Ruminococcus sp.]|uniref:glycosyltransferase family 39 protein n=1 Tax=Ruminococcus sp. TaxID=41978 RepID=UPI003890447E
MAENKAARVLARLFNALFFFVFTLLFLEIVFRRYGEETGKNLFWADYKQHLGIVLVALIITALALLVYRFVVARPPRRSRRLRAHETQTTGELGKKALVIIFVATGIILVLQVLAAYYLWNVPVTDSRAMHVYSTSIATEGNFDIVRRSMESGDYYLIEYPNQTAMLLINSLVYRIWYLMTGNITRMPMVGINVLSINAAILMTALLARKVYGDKKALMALGLCALFVPYFTYTAYVYTDTFSIPYVVGVVWMFLSVMTMEKPVPRTILMVVCGMLTFIGFKIKGNLIVLVVALLGYALLKLRFKRFLVLALAFVMGFACLNVVYKVALKTTNIMQQDHADRYEFPSTHWIMMGLHGHGGFDMDDYRFTQGFTSKKEKQEANIEVIKEDLKEMGVDGLLEFLTTKEIWTWGDGTYYVSNHIGQPIKKNVLHEYLLPDGKHYYRQYAYSCGFQYFLILMMALSALKGFIKGKLDPTLLFRVAVFGVFLFLMMWETRSRYLFNFTPFFLLLAVDGADSGVRIIRKVKEMCKRNEG